MKVWQRSHALVLQIYRLTTGFPDDERYGRAAVSIPANIAEGSKRRRNNDYARFLNIAEGSAAEVDYLLILSRDLELVTAKAAEPIRAELDEIARMLNGLRGKVERSA